VSATASQKKIFVEPTIVTDGNISAYTVHDVVLPLAGYDVMFPQNAIGALYMTWLAEDGLVLDDLKHKVKLVFHCRNISIYYYMTRHR